MKVVKIKTESIKLGQFLKVIGVVMTGGEVKFFLLKNDVKVNKNDSKSRGKCLFNGDFVEINGEEFTIEVEKWLYKT